MGLKKVVRPFDICSEEQVRAAVVAYFSDLGFADTDFSFEDHFYIRLGHNSVRVNKPDSPGVGGKSDLLLTKNGEPFVLVEVKKGDLPLSQDVAEQGLSYARAILKMPPFTIITNGNEFRVFDTITAEELLSELTDSTWFKNGQTLSNCNLSEEAKGKACRWLVRNRIEVLKEFSSVQVDEKMESLRGDDFQRYRPSLYTERHAVAESFQDFLKSDKLIFPIIGPSGLGKSNEICRLTEYSLECPNILPFFYRVVCLGAKNPFQALCDDFSWEFHRREEITHLFQSLSDLAEKHGNEVLLFFDGLDETLAGFSNFKASFIELAERLRASRFRVCVTCKPEEWKELISERGAGKNIIGKVSYGADAQLMGISLDVFSDEELNAAEVKYQAAYGTSKRIAWRSRELCKNPFNLRIAFEANDYDSSSDSIEFSANCYEQYIRRKLVDFDRDERNFARATMWQLAEFCVKNGRPQVPVLEFTEEAKKLEILEKLNRFGLLSYVDDDATIIEFAFGRLLLYSYVTHSRKWTTIKKPSVFIDEVRDANKTRIGRECLPFYLEIHQRSETLSLLDILKQDVEVFLTIARSIPFSDKNGPRIKISRDDQALMEKVQKFVSSYSILRESLLLLKPFVEPNTFGEAGFWLSDNGWHGFRSLTTNFPNQITWLDENSFQPSSFTPKFTRESSFRIRPAPTRYTDLVGLLNVNLPEIAALHVFAKQLREPCFKQTMDESYSTVLISERLIGILEDNPMFGLEKTPRGVFLKQLGFESWEELEESGSGILLRKADDFIKRYIESAKSAPDEQHQNWYAMYWPHVHSIFRYSVLVHNLNLGLQAQAKAGRELARELLENPQNDSLQQRLSMFIRTAKESFLEIASSNFGEIADSFRAFRYFKENTSLLVEVCYSGREGSLQPFPSVTFIWLPSLENFGLRVRLLSEEDSIANTQVRSRISLGPIYVASEQIQITEGREVLSESNAMLSRIKLGCSYPVADVVYGLLLNEAPSVFSQREFDWYRSSSGGFLSSRERVEPNIPNTVPEKLYNIGLDVNCICGHQSELTARLRKEASVLQGSRDFPNDDILVCDSCGETISLREERLRLESEMRRKILR